MKYTIYRFLFPDGQSYIGATSRSPEQRWQHGEGYKGQSVYSAIAQYGWDKIKKEILAEAQDAETACELEQLYIDKYDSVNNGYNVNKACLIGTGQALTIVKAPSPHSDFTVVSNSTFAYVINDLSKNALKLYFELVSNAGGNFYEEPQQIRELRESLEKEKTKSIVSFSDFYQ